jgi:hypothetical protein
VDLKRSGDEVGTVEKLSHYKRKNLLGQDCTPISSRSCAAQFPHSVKMGWGWSSGASKETATGPSTSDQNLPGSTVTENVLKDGRERCYKVSWLYCARFKWCLENSEWAVFALVI